MTQSVERKQTHRQTEVSKNEGGALIKKFISDRLLDEETAKVEKQVAKALKGKYVTLSSDGWKDKYSVTGVDASVDGKTLQLYLIDLIYTRGKKKDGKSMCKSFFDQIDKAEDMYKCIVVGYVCDNDGGSQNGRKRTAPLRQAEILRRTDIIDGQVGAEKNKKKCKKMEDEANGVCDLLDDPTFWKDLQVVSDDIEPICYITNINQGFTRVCWGISALQAPFNSNPTVAAGMMKRIEKRWAAMDQDFFVMALVGSSIRSEHVEAGFIDPRQQRKNHDKSRVASLIAVPQYADLLENEESDDEAEERTSSRLVNS
ncbi:hypothetical protein C8J57DRAFT_1220062 [Mycena rebaudengoi]|nr:hypothetical protein C8J57DRAFT_1220062 [Mycena rebaudengoi]